MKEEFLYYLWKFSLFNKDIKTCSGDDIRIISPGLRNTDSGPDFINSRIRIGTTFWAGNVEIHIKASDWLRHGHDSDPAYDNVIMHVVYHCDTYVKRKNGEIIPVFEVNGSFNKRLIERYTDFSASLAWVACENMIGELDKHYLNVWLERLVIERLERKSADVAQVLIECNNNWEQTFYQILSKCFGFSVNAVPFELLSKSIPIKYLAKHCDDLFQIEALLFGQAGFLNSTYKEEYPKKLKSEYQYLSQKYSLKSGNRFIWRFLRLRPSNFPTVRIAQLARLIYNSPQIFTAIMECDALDMIYILFDVSASNFWNNHYRFDKKSKCREKKLGKEAIQLFIINAVAPVLYYYGKVNDLKKFQDRAVDFLSDLKPENNAVIKRWKSYGLKPDSSAQSQALLELKTSYCDNKRCLQCAVGSWLIRY